MTKKNFRSYTAFFIVGASNTLIDFLFFFFNCLLCPLFSRTVRNWTFQVKKEWAAVNGAASLLTYIVLYVMQLAGFSLFLSKAIGTFLGMMITLKTNKERSLASSK
ncbi:hypothetical protein [Bacillus pumilus]|uniref:hypothetical protein n=1 Tax=Bacillus TaxID=1386 RepID=UPI002281396C|nr:hypothetical protein [Bacillus pumilus]MCY7680343.1 hypothetical protein [Bacillus pumilus]